LIGCIKKFRLFPSFGLIAILCVSTPVFSQLKKTQAGGGDAGTESVFMEAGVGARAQGFGQAFVAIANDGSAVYWNPAGLDYLNQPNFVAYHSTLGVGFYNFISITYPFVNIGSVGFGAARNGVTGIPYYDLNNNFQQNGDFDTEEFYFSYGKKLPWFGLALGTTFKIARQAATDQDNPGGTLTSIGSGLDIGLMYRPDADNAVLRNMSVGMNFQNVIAPRFKLATTEDPYPRNLKLGIAKDFLFGGDRLKRFTITADVNKGQFRKNLTYAFGGEFAYSRYVIGRGGIDNGRIALGVGTEFQQFQKFQIDYSVNIGSALGTVLHRLSLTINFGKTVDERIQLARNLRIEEDQKLIAKTQEIAKTRAIKEHSAMGLENFQKRKWLSALVEFEQVNSLDPNNSSAKSYLDSINTKMDEQLNAQLADTANAIRDFTVRNENDKFIRDHYNKGLSLVKKGDYISALAEFENARDRSYNKADMDKTIADTRTLLDRKIGSMIAKARSSAAANNFGEALKLLSEARSLDPGNQIIQKEIDVELKRINTRLIFLDATRNGLDKYQKGDYQAAIDEFEKAILIDPSNETVKEYHKKAIVHAFATFKNLEGGIEKQYLQGVDLYVEGKYEQAIVVWQRILESDPYNKRVINAIDKAEEQLKALKSAKQR